MERIVEEFDAAQYRSLKERFDQVVVENDTLREAIAELTGEGVEWPSLSGFTCSEKRVLQFLYKTKSARKEQIYQALYWNRHDVEQPEPKIIDVLVCRIRAKLPCRDFIKTIWGEGYQLSPEGREWLEERVAA